MKKMSLSHSTCGRGWNALDAFGAGGQLIQENQIANMNEDPLV